MASLFTDALTPLRWLLRGSVFLIHGTLGVIPAVGFQSALGRRIRWGGKGLDERMLNLWSNWTCRLFGLHVNVSGRPLDGPVLIVANHLLWADIQAMHSVASMSFVAKAEIANWPVFGFLANAGGTVYHQRGSHDSSAGVLAQVLQKLDEGRRVAIFPEGGVFPGDHVKRFHARMFKVAVEAGCPIQPAMIRYVRNGRRDPEVTFIRGENFVVNLIRLMGRPGSRAELVFLDPIFPAGEPRKQLALVAEAAVREAFDAPVTDVA